MDQSVREFPTLFCGYNISIIEVYLSWSFPSPNFTYSSSQHPSIFLIPHPYFLHPYLSNPSFIPYFFHLVLYCSSFLSCLNLSCSIFFNICFYLSIHHSGLHFLLPFTHCSYCLILSFGCLVFNVVHKFYFLFFRPICP